MSLSFWLDLSSDSRAEFCLIFRSFFGQWSFKKKCFWDLLTFSSGFKKLHSPHKGAASLKIVENDYFSDVFLTKFSFLDHSACQIKSVSDVIANATENPCWIWWHNFFPEKISQTIVNFGTIWTERFIFEIFVINYLVYCNLWAQGWIVIRLF